MNFFDFECASSTSRFVGEVNRCDNCGMITSEPWDNARKSCCPINEGLDIEGGAEATQQFGEYDGHFRVEGHAE